MILVESKHAHHRHGETSVHQKHLAPRVHASVWLVRKRPRAMLAQDPPPVARRAQDLASIKVRAVISIELCRDEQPDHKGELRKRDVARHRALASSKSRGEEFRIHHKLEYHRERDEMRPRENKILMRMPHAPRMRRQSHERARRRARRDEPPEPQRPPRLRPRARQRAPKRAHDAPRDG